MDFEQTAKCSEDRQSKGFSKACNREKVLTHISRRKIMFRLSRSWIARRILSATMLSLALCSGIVLAQESFAPGAVYAIFDRATDGTATFRKFRPTGRYGTGKSLENQGAVTLAGDIAVRTRDRDCSNRDLNRGAGSVRLSCRQRMSLKATSRSREVCSNRNLGRGPSSLREFCALQTRPVADKSETICTNRVIGRGASEERKACVRTPA